ncbi:MAG: S8 family serine peptidase [Vicinamibacterales bacterium]
MRGFPATIRLAGGRVARVDPTRLVARLASPGRAGHPVLTSTTRRRLAAMGLRVEGDAGPGGDDRGLLEVNHGSRHVWLRSTGKRAVASVATVGRATGRSVQWLAPVYRLTGVQGPDAWFLARPDVILLRAAAKAHAPLSRLTSPNGLHEDSDKSRYLGGWRYFEVDQGSRGNALVLRERLLKAGVPAELEYVPLRSMRLFTPDDEYFPSQWNMTRVGAPAAWDVTTGDARVIVAVIDSGCDLEHADLRHAYVPGGGFNAGDLTLDGSPVVLAMSGRRDGHGTSVVSVIAAEIDNALGLAGLASGCRVLPVALPEGSTAELAVGIRKAAMDGARVLNLSVSIGDFYFRTYVRDAIDDAVAADCVICASAGNSDTSPLVPIARYPPVMGIGGSDEMDRRWRDPAHGLGSHFGDELVDGVSVGVSVVAPAVDIWAADLTGFEGSMLAPSPLGDYIRGGTTVTGERFPSPFGMTSAATPHVSAAAALLRSAHALSATDVRRVIERTADRVGPYAYEDVPGYPGGSRHPEMGYGRLDVFRALDLGDVMIADWPGDRGVEPSTPPGGNFYTFSDIVIQPAPGGAFDPSDPMTAGVIERGRDHVAWVRVRNAGPAVARGVRVSLRATPWVGLEFEYPEDWMGTGDPPGVRPDVVDAGPFTLAAGEARLAEFRFTAAQIETMAGWSDTAWHPCLLGVATATNDYAFDAAPGGPALQMRRNNLAQRNLTVAPVALRRSARFPFVMGHPANPDPRLEVVIDAATLVRAGEVWFVPSDDGKSFPAGRRARAFASERVRIGRVSGGKPGRVGGRRAIRLTHPRSVVEVFRPRAARFVAQVVVRLPAKRPAATSWPVRIEQRVEGLGATGGATVIFVSD